MKIYEILNEKQWAGDVKTSWHPPVGFFSQRANEIAAGLKRSHRDLKSAMGSLNFYINRAGGNLSKSTLQELERAKGLLHDLYQ